MRIFLCETMRSHLVIWQWAADREPQGVGVEFPHVPRRAGMSYNRKQGGTSTHRHHLCTGPETLDKICQALGEFLEM